MEQAVIGEGEWTRHVLESYVERQPTKNLSPDVTEREIDWSNVIWFVFF